MRKINRYGRTNLQRAIQTSAGRNIFPYAPALPVNLGAADPATALLNAGAAALSFLDSFVSAGKAEFDSYSAESDYSNSTDLLSASLAGMSSTKVIAAAAAVTMVAGFTAIALTKGK